MAVLERVKSAFRSPAKIKQERENNPDGPATNGKSRPGESEDGNETSKKESKPTPVGFWHPGLRQVRNRAFAKWTITTAVLMSFILAVLSLYWAVFFKVENRLKNLSIYVVDMDGVAPFDNTGNTPFVGRTITELVQQQLSSGMPTLGWSIRDAAEFNNDPIAVRQAVYNFDTWAAIIINPNASALLYSAIETGNTSYDPIGACQLVYQDARDDTNWFDFIYPIMAKVQTEATSMVGKEWAKMALQQAGSDQAIFQNLQNVPQALSPAIGFSEFNLRPFYPYTGIPAVSIGLICKSFVESHDVLGNRQLTTAYRSHHYILLQLLFLYADSHAVHQT